jgi:alanine racemase
MTEDSFNRVVVDCAALTRNYRLVREMAGVPVMAMVKADGYGHGMVCAAEAFARGGCTLFGVGELAEGVRLRRAGVTGEIFVTLGFADEDAAAFASYQLTPVLYRFASALALSRAATEAGQAIGVHIKVDTGMGRLGVLPAELASFVAAVRDLPGIRVAGIMSHLAEADIPQAASTARALASFAEAGQALSLAEGIIRHIANSGAVLFSPESRGDMVRCGIALYGYHPAGRVAGTCLQPAMSLVSRVLQVKQVPAGVGISYGHTFRTTRPTTLAVLPVGYEDGYSRALSNQAEVLVRGRRAPVRGRVCMNMSMVEVTEIEGVEAGDEVVLLGSQGDESVDADELAAKIGSISYEVLCLLGNNNKREYR